MNPLISNAKKDNEEVEDIGEKNIMDLEKQNLKDNNNFNYEWISEGKIFQKLSSKKKAYRLRKHLNQYEILKELDIAINDNFVLNVENEILHKENDSMKTMIQMMNKKENEMLETYKIERMMVDAL